MDPTTSVYKAYMLHLLFFLHICFQRNSSVIQSLTIDSHVSQSSIEVFKKTNHRKGAKSINIEHNEVTVGTHRARQSFGNKIAYAGCTVGDVQLFISCKMMSVLNSKIYEGGYNGTVSQLTG